jgi:tRNA 2-thiouridine synthesizing protein A
MQIIDAKGLKCPMPVIKLQNAVRQAKPGDRLQILSTDKGVCQDIPSWCRINKHTIVEQAIDDSLYLFTIQVGP